MDNVSKKELTDNVEHIMSYLLSKKYGCTVRIYFKKEQLTDEYID